MGKLNHNDVSISIVLPIPARVLHPNFSIGSYGMRMAVASARKKMRRLACEAVQAEGVDDAPWPKCSVKAEFHYKYNRKRDDDNANGSLKSSYDGVVDAGLVENDDHAHMTRESPEFVIDKESQFVVLRITRIENDENCCKNN